MNGFFAGIFAFFVALLPVHGPVTEFHGYIEANFTYVGAASAGRIETINVQEGDHVAEGVPLFTLENDEFEAGLRAAEARVAVARANRDNLETGSRDAEIAVIRASLSKAMADQQLARQTLDRSLKLLERELVPPAKVDADQAALESANAEVAQLQAQLDVAELPARDAQRVSAEAGLVAAIADADRARDQLADRNVVAPSAGLVESIYFKPGEVAGTGAAIMALLPPGDLKARFFIPEPERARFTLGDELALSCDNCPDGIVATITYMASEPQHTPPVIYSRDERARLVFMAEARIEGETGLLPGQPVTVSVDDE